MHASQFLAQLSRFSKQDLINIKGIGETLADNFLQFVQSERYTKLQQDFLDLENSSQGLDIQVLKKSNQNLPLSGQTICITGTFDISRSQIQAKLEELGAKITNTVSKQTNILIAGENAGSKLSKAMELNIKVIHSLQELLG